MTNLLAAALDYAAHRTLVFPLLSRGKAPAVARGFHAATTNPKTIRRFWRDPDRNIGIPTGMTSGFWVLDVDGPEGEASLRELEARHGGIPKTREVITSRGRHVWFAYPGPIPSSAGKIGAGLDVRGDLAYAIAPPSVHETGHIYQWAGDPWCELAPAPAWLIAAARARPERSISDSAVAMIRAPHHGDSYGRAALRAETSWLSGLSPGSRNDGLNRAAFSLFQLVAGGELAESEVVAELERACVANGLANDDGWHCVHATISSGRRAGLQHPRSSGRAR
jgi:hypothetical protein